MLIIEDETFIAMDLETLVESLGHRVLGIARTHTEALALARKKTPGLILADIQLADGSSGLDAVNELLKTFEVPVIFITAYPERFLTGERPEPAFLIAKPFQPAMVSAIASQALFFSRNAQNRGRSPAALIVGCFENGAFEAQRRRSPAASAPTPTAIASVDQRPLLDFARELAQRSLPRCIASASIVADAAGIAC